MTQQRKKYNLKRIQSFKGISQNPSPALLTRGRAGEGF
jgi:hypothetical protein